MKRKTYNNVLKAGKLIQAKGYSEKESLEIAVQKFDELASLKNGMSVEWLIDRMATKTEREGESMKLSESDKSYFKWSKNKIEEMEKPYENQRLWRISDCFGNIWNVLFTGNVDEYRISYKDEFSVDILMPGNMVEIHRAIKDGRSLKADRNLKQFMQLALLVSCYKKFGLIL